MAILPYPVPTSTAASHAPLAWLSPSEVATMTYFIVCLFLFIVALLDSYYGGSTWF